MPSRGEIKSEKILVKDIFSNMWFRIPEYQRPYVWGSDEIGELLDDLTFALTEKPDFEYFLGSFVFQSKVAQPEKGQEFDENDLLDGQQRMTTLLLLFAVIRDLARDPDAKDDCQKCIFQRASKYKKIPERTRLVFAIRETVQEFIESFIKNEGGTEKSDQLVKLGEKNEDISVQNMAKAVVEISKFFRNGSSPSPEGLLQFLLNKVLLIYVSTEDLEDAFRLFMILNDRGIPLRNSDILKSMNLGAMEAHAEKVKYAKMWEEAEGELGDDFDRFLSHVRTILVKDKARLNLLQEYEDKIYDPKERDVEHILPQNPKSTSQWVNDFSNDDRSEWTDKLGNLVLITRRKNSSQGRLDYHDKKKRYFEKCIDTCPNSLRVLHQNEKWTLEELKQNHESVLKRLCEHYNITSLT